MFLYRLFSIYFTANNTRAKLTSQFQMTRLITSPNDNNFSIDSEDNFRTGCRNVTHQQQFFSELLSPGRSHYTNYDLFILFTNFKL